MAVPVMPFLLGVLAGSAATYLYRGARTGRPNLRGYRMRRRLRVDAEPVEDTIGLEAAYVRRPQT